MPRWSISDEQRVIDWLDDVLAWLRVHPKHICSPGFNRTSTDRAPPRTPGCGSSTPAERRLGRRRPPAEAVDTSDPPRRRTPQDATRHCATQMASTPAAVTLSPEHEQHRSRIPRVEDRVGPVRQPDRRSRPPGPPPSRIAFEMDRLPGRTCSRPSRRPRCSGEMATTRPQAQSRSLVRRTPWRGWWGGNPYHQPVFVLTHHEREPLLVQDDAPFHCVVNRRLTPRYRQL